jgi:hypothetical protein
MINKHKALATAAVVCIALAAGSVVTPAQQPYRAPRTPDKQPDLQGIWQVLNTAEWDLRDHGAQLGVPPGRSVVENNEIPYQAWALAEKQKNYENRKAADPGAKCYYPGVPRITYMPYPFQIVQTKTYVMFLYEYGHHTRIIYTDGAPHHEEIPFWMGDSRGRWEGETLVVDTKNFNAETWFDKAGNFHSEALRV